MDVTPISTPNQDEFALIEGDSTSSPSTILKGKLLPACDVINHNLQHVSIFDRVSNMYQTSQLVQTYLSQFHQCMRCCRSPQLLWSCHLAWWDLHGKTCSGWKEDRRYEGKTSGYFIWPQCCKVSPLILPAAPRDAGSLGVDPTARHKLPSVVDDREGVFTSPLGGE